MLKNRMRTINNHWLACTQVPIYSGEQTHQIVKKGARPHENIQKVQWKVKKKRNPARFKSQQKKKQQLVITTKNQNSQTLLYKHPDKVRMLLHEFIPRTNKDHKNKNGPKKKQRQH